MHRNKPENLIFCVLRMQNSQESLKIALLLFKLSCLSFHLNVALWQILLSINKHLNKQSIIQNSNDVVLFNVVVFLFERIILDSVLYCFRDLMLQYHRHHFCIGIWSTQSAQPMNSRHWTMNSLGRTLVNCRTFNFSWFRMILSSQVQF